MYDFHFLYLHGYQGSPDSIKAKKLKKWLQATYSNVYIDAPSLEMHSQNVLKTINTLLNKTTARQKVIIGSSLGGYMAHLFKQTRNDIDRVILINPAVRLDLIAADECYSAYKEDAQALIDAMPTSISHLQDYLVLLQEDDWITPSVFAQEAFAGAQIDIQTGQGHDYDQIETSFSIIKDFLQTRVIAYD